MRLLRLEPERLADESVADLFALLANDKVDPARSVRTILAQGSHGQTENRV